MKVAVWDTYVTKTDGTKMHFDIVVPHSLKQADIIHTFGQEYLSSLGYEGLKLDSEECRYCHMETAPEHVVSGIDEKGYFIIEMENCR